LREAFAAQKPYCLCVNFFQLGVPVIFAAYNSSVVKIEVLFILR
jgi:hypothetical protein